MSRYIPRRTILRAFCISFTTSSNYPLQASRGRFVSWLAEFSLSYCMTEFASLQNKRKKTCCLNIKARCFLVLWFKIQSSETPVETLYVFFVHIAYLVRAITTQKLTPTAPLPSYKLQTWEEEKTSYPDRMSTVVHHQSTSRKIIHTFFIQLCFFSLSFKG